MNLDPQTIAEMKSRGASVGRSVGEALADMPASAPSTPPPASEKPQRIKPPLRGERQLSVSLQLPWPPTVNNLFINTKRGRVASPAAKRYRATVADMCMVHNIGHVVGRNLRCEVWAYPPDKRRRDLDNLWKSCLDSLQAAGVFEDDSQFSTLTIHRGEVGDGALSVTIYGSTPAEEAAGW